MDIVRQDSQIDENEKRQKLNALRMKSISDVLEEVEVVVVAHFKSSKKEGMVVSETVRETRV